MSSSSQRQSQIPLPRIVTTDHHYIYPCTNYVTHLNGQKVVVALANKDYFDDCDIMRNNLTTRRPDKFGIIRPNVSENGHLYGYTKDGIARASLYVRHGGKYVFNPLNKPLPIRARF
jgi:hypothetical protein